MEEIFKKRAEEARKALQKKKENALLLKLMRAGIQTRIPPILDVDQFGIVDEDFLDSESLYSGECYSLNDTSGEDELSGEDEIRGEGEISGEPRHTDV